MDPILVAIVLPGDHPWRAEASALGTLVWDGDAHNLDEAARAPVDLLLVDAAALSEADVLHLRRFRVRRPAARVVVHLPPHAAPGDPIPAALVALGVYDLHQGDGAAAPRLAEILGRTPTYADAARWQTALATAAAGEPPRERVVERKVAVSQRPVLIAVLGVAQGVGTTRLAAAVAYHLARLGHRTALAEYGEPSLAAIADVAPGGAWRPNLYLYPRRLEEDGTPGAPPPPPLELLRLRQHAYLVCDHGYAHLRDVRPSEPDLMLVACPGELHRHPRLAAWLPENQDPEARFVVLGGSPEEARDVVEAVGGRRLAFARHTWPPADPELDRALSALLAPVLPDPPVRRRLTFFR